MAIAWSGFILMVLALLLADLGLFQRRSRELSMAQSLALSAVWISIGLGFAVVVYLGFEHHWFGLGTHIDPIDGKPNTGARAAAKYLTAYIVEKSLSIDNLFVMSVIFSRLSIPRQLQHGVLFWGILGAMILRGAMIVGGVALVIRFDFVLYIFAIVLIVGAVKMLVSNEDSAEAPATNWFVRAAGRFCAISDQFDGKKFITRNAAGAWLLTPLAVALIAIEGADVVFAIDSIPAVFAVTANPLLIFASNILAILGLRSLYFAVDRLIAEFRYLKTSVGAILFIIGLAMLARHPLQNLLGDNVRYVLLGATVLSLAIGIIASLRHRKLLSMTTETTRD